jgi:tetratricopeptide (TPR) repeat protein
MKSPSRFSRNQVGAAASGMEIMSARSPRKVILCIAALIAAAGCSEVRGRRLVQQGNRHYRDGQYKEAIASFQDAEKYVPNLPQLWLNKGYTCRQILVPGSKTPETTEAAKCAKEALTRYRGLAPQDPRGEMLYVQTLFDNDEFEELSKMYQDRFQKNPRDVEAINGLIQVYSKWNKLDETLEWYDRKAELMSNDAEAQYAAGVFIYNQLFTKGGGPEKSSHDPRPDPNKPKDVKVHPAFGMGDIVSQQRVDLADKGVKYLEKAVALLPKYHQAMTYANLLYRQKSFAYFEYPEDWQKSVNEALKWYRRSLETQGMKVPENVQKATDELAAKEASGVKDAPAKADKKKAAPGRKKVKRKRS